MATLINGVDIYAPVFKVKLVKEDKILPIDSFTSMELEEDLESPAMFRLSLNETINTKDQTFTWLDNKSITPGTEVLIFFGYANAPKKQSLIRGKIKALLPGFLSTGIPTLSIEGYDLSHDLQKTEKKFNDNNVKYSQVVKEIATKNGFESTAVEPTKIVHAKIERKKNEMDYAFLRRLAKEIEFEFFVRNKTLYFRNPKDTVPANIVFEFRKNFISFNPRMTTATLVNEVRITAWDNRNKEGISETASIKDITSKLGIPNFDTIVEQSQGKKVNIKAEGYVVNSKEEAKNLAIAILKRRNSGFIQGPLECVGDPQLRPGMTIKIEKIGHFSGTYYATKVKHSISENGYKTTLDVRRSI